jgi:MATE family multidrug resistance protein
MMDLIRIGWPISAATIAEVSLFLGASVMMGWLGTIPLAAHGIALQLTAITFMIPLGLSHAATVRVGHAFGAGDHLGAGRAGYAAVIIIAVTATLSAIMFLLIPEPLVRLYLDSANEDSQAVLAYGVSLLFIAALFQVMDSMQVILIGNLRGLKDTKVPMYIAVFSYWMVGIPSAYLLAFTFGLEGVGLWIGLAIGLIAASSLLFWRFAARERLGLMLQS